MDEERHEQSLLGRWRDIPAGMKTLASVVLVDIFWVISLPTPKWVTIPLLVVPVLFLCAFAIFVWKSLRRRAPDRP